MPSPADSAARLDLLTVLEVELMKTNSRIGPETVDCPASHRPVAEKAGTDGTPATRVVVVEDHPIIVQGVLTVTAREPDIDVVGAVATCSDGIHMITRLRPDVAVVDYDLSDGDGDGLELVRHVSLRAPATRVLLFTGYASEHLVALALEAGCSALLPKGRPLSHLVDAIRAVATGRDYPPADAQLRLVDGRCPSPRHRRRTALTIRELELLALAATGASNQEIADDLFMSVNTVRNHVKRILLKLGTHSKLEAVAVALQQGIVSPPTWRPAPGRP